MLDEVREKEFDNRMEWDRKWNGPMKERRERMGTRMGTWDGGSEIQKEEGEMEGSSGRKEGSDCQFGKNISNTLLYGIQIIKYSHQYLDTKYIYIVK
jgi:hypothetical protein